VLTVNRGPSPDFKAVHGNRDPPVVEAGLAAARAAMLQEELGELCHGDEEASVQHHRWDWAPPSATRSFVWSGWTSRAEMED
jgi:hypothetical protein